MTSKGTTDSGMDNLQTLSGTISRNVSVLHLHKDTEVKSLNARSKVLQETAIVMLVVEAKLQRKTRAVTDTL